MKTIIGILLIACCFGCATSRMQKASTDDLKLRHAQLVESLSGSQFNMRFGPPIMMAFAGDGGRQDRINEKERIERELLRRYKSGDQRAYLAMFSH